MDGEPPGVPASFFGLNIPAMSLRITFDSWQIESNLATGLVGVMLCLARLRSAIAFASLFGVARLNLAGDSGTPSSRGRVGLVGVEWRNGEDMFEVVV